MCVTQQSICVPGHIHVLAYLLADTEHILVCLQTQSTFLSTLASMGFPFSTMNSCVCVRVCVQVAQYRSNKQEARRAKLAEEQAELDDMYKKQAEEDVCFLSA